MPESPYSVADSANDAHYQPEFGRAGKPGRACRKSASRTRLGLSGCARRRTPRICAPLGRACLAGEIQSAIDQTYMTVGLRKISQQAAGNGVELFGKQTDVVAA